MLKLEQKFVIGKTPVEFLGHIKELSFYRTNNDLCYVVRENVVIGEIHTDMNQGVGFVSQIIEVNNGK